MPSGKPADDEIDGEKFSDMLARIRSQFAISGAEQSAIPGLERPRSWSGGLRPNRSTRGRRAQKPVAVPTHLALSLQARGDD
jgi:hypothetical protein